MELFEDSLCEVVHDDIRYILRRNPKRAQEIEEVRAEKKEVVLQLLGKKNIYLVSHPGAHVDVAVDVEQMLTHCRRKQNLTAVM
ncbi:MAG: hypothetical protein NTU90_04205 [Proteobacteria bacterium]|nr:hypothetical protein [Pseudomonadota bacterium]